ncbi:hypothetical protein ACNKHO_05110 [Shigella flexneri]
MALDKAGKLAAATSTGGYDQQASRTRRRQSASGGRG